MTAAFRNAFPALAEELDRLRREREELRLAICPDGSIDDQAELLEHAAELRHADEMLCDVLRIEQERDDARRECERLRDALGAAVTAADMAAEAGSRITDGTIRAALDRGEREERND